MDGFAPDVVWDRFVVIGPVIDGYHANGVVVDVDVFE